MNDKKRRDTLAVINSQLNMIDERLADRQYIPIWDLLKIQKDKLVATIKTLDQ